MRFPRKPLISGSPQCTRRIDINLRSRSWRVTTTAAQALPTASQCRTLALTIRKDRPALHPNTSTAVNTCFDLPRRRPGETYICKSRFHTSTMRQKRLILSFDGTGQSSMRGPAAIDTNVTRLCSALKDNTSQVIFYQSGVGTATIGEMYATVAGGTGLGINDNILDAYQFLSNNYENGDEIFLFGFSRGAFTACILANLVLRLGLFKKRYLWMMRKGWARYITPDNGAAFDDFVENLWRIDRDRTRRVTIKILGLWDAVGSVGMPDYEWVKSAGFNSSYSFYDPRLRYGVENAFHALAIDELRRPFMPNLLYLPDPKSNTLGLPEINLKQCWLPGVHTNVGGGYPDQHMADISLFWMLEQCHGLLDFDETYIAHLIHCNHFPQYNSGKLRRGISRIYPGWGYGKIEDSYWKNLMPLLGRSYRKPGQSTEGVTNETMHRSVRRRWQSKHLSWRPWALNGFVPEKDGSSGKWKWVKRESADSAGHGAGGQGIIEIPEETFARAPHTSYQSRLRDIGAKRLRFQRKLDFLARDSHAYLRDEYEPAVKPATTGKDGVGSS